MINLYKFKGPLPQSLLWLILSLGWVNTVSAQSQTKQWTNLSLRGSLLNETQWIYLLDAQSRYHLDPNEFEEGLVRAGLGWQSTPKMSLWTGYQFVSRNQVTGRNQENRLWQQLLWQVVNKDFVNILSQSRVEERTRQAQAQWSIRFRQQMMLEFPRAISSRISPLFWDELFFNITKPSWVSSATVEQNRAFLGIKIVATSSSFLSLGYLNQYLFNSTGNQMNNIIFMGFNLNT